MDLARQAQDPGLTDAEKAAMRTAAAALAALTGAAGDIAGTAVDRHKRDQAEAAGKRPMFTTPATNPVNAGLPTP
jgi:hypothetical protein